MVVNSARNLQEIMSKIYYNAPAPLFAKFLLEGDINMWYNVLHVACYHAYQKYKDDDELDDEEKLKKVADDLCINIATKSNIEAGKKICENYKCTAYMGIEHYTYWDYRDYNHMEEPRVLLLAYLATKSLIGTREYAKITNDYLLARMNGWNTIIPRKKLHPILRKYSSHYKIRHLKELLYTHYHVATYSQTRGFYVSCELELDELIMNVKNSKKTSKLAEDTRRILAQLKS